VLEKCKIMDSNLVFWGKTIGWARKVISEELSSNVWLLFDYFYTCTTAKTKTCFTCSL